MDSFIPSYRCSRRVLPLGKLLISGFPISTVESAFLKLPPRRQDGHQDTFVGHETNARIGFTKSADVVCTDTGVEGTYHAPETTCSPWCSEGGNNGGHGEPVVCQEHLVVPQQSATSKGDTGDKYLDRFTSLDKPIIERYILKACDNDDLKKLSTVTKDGRPDATTLLAVQNKDTFRQSTLEEIKSRRTKALSSLIGRRDVDGEEYPEEVGEQLESLAELEGTNSGGKTLINKILKIILQTKHDKFRKETINLLGHMTPAYNPFLDKTYCAVFGHPFLDKQNVSHTRKIDAFNRYDRRDASSTTDDGDSRGCKTASVSGSSRPASVSDTVPSSSKSSGPSSYPSSTSTHALSSKHHPSSNYPSGSHRAGQTFRPPTEDLAIMVIERLLYFLYQGGGGNLEPSFIELFREKGEELVRNAFLDWHLAPSLRPARVDASGSEVSRANRHEPREEGRRGAAPRQNGTVVRDMRMVILETDTLPFNLETVRHNSETVRTTVDQRLMGRRDNDMLRVNGTTVARTSLMMMASVSQSSAQRLAVQAGLYPHIDWSDPELKFLIVYAITEILERRRKDKAYYKRKLYKELQKREQDSQGNECSKSGSRSCIAYTECTKSTTGAPRWDHSGTPSEQNCERPFDADMDVHMTYVKPDEPHYSLAAGESPSSCKSLNHGEQPYALDVLRSAGTSRKSVPHTPEITVSNAVSTSLDTAAGKDSPLPCRPSFIVDNYPSPSDPVNDSATFDSRRVARRSHDANATYLASLGATHQVTGPVLRPKEGTTEETQYGKSGTSNAECDPRRAKLQSEANAVPTSVIQILSSRLETPSIFYGDGTPPEVYGGATDEFSHVKPMNSDERPLSACSSGLNIQSEEDSLEEFEHDIHLGKGLYEELTQILLDFSDSQPNGDALKYAAARLYKQLVHRESQFSREQSKTESSIRVARREGQLVHPDGNRASSCGGQQSSDQIPSDDDGDANTGAGSGDVTIEGHAHVGVHANLGGHDNMGRHVDVWDVIPNKNLDHHDSLINQYVKVLLGYIENGKNHVFEPNFQRKQLFLLDILSTIGNKDPNLINFLEGLLQLEKKTLFTQRPSVPVGTIIPRSPTLSAAESAVLGVVQSPIESPCLPSGMKSGQRVSPPGAALLALDLPSSAIGRVSQRHAVTGHSADETRVVYNVSSMIGAVGAGISGASESPSGNGIPNATLHHLCHDGSPYRASDDDSPYRNAAHMQCFDSKYDEKESKEYDSSGTKKFPADGNESTGSIVRPRQDRSRNARIGESHSVTNHGVTKYGVTNIHGRATDFNSDARIFYLPKFESSVREETLETLKRLVLEDFAEFTQDQTWLHQIGISSDNDVDFQKILRDMEKVLKIFLNSLQTDPEPQIKIVAVDCIRAMVTTKLLGKHLPRKLHLEILKALRATFDWDHSVLMSLQVHKQLKYMLTQQLRFPLLGKDPDRGSPQTHLGEVNHQPVLSQEAQQVLRLTYSQLVSDPLDVLIPSFGKVDEPEPEKLGDFDFGLYDYSQVMLGERQTTILELLNISTIDTTYELITPILGLPQLRRYEGVNIQQQHRPECDHQHSPSGRVCQDNTTSLSRSPNASSKLDSIRPSDPIDMPLFLEALKDLDKILHQITPGVVSIIDSMIEKLQTQIQQGQKSYQEGLRYLSEIIRTFNEHRYMLLERVSSFLVPPIQQGHETKTISRLAQLVAILKVIDTLISMPVSMMPASLVPLPAVIMEGFEKALEEVGNTASVDASVRDADVKMSDVTMNVQDVTMNARCDHTTRYSILENAKRDIRLRITKLKEKLTLRCYRINLQDYLAMKIRHKKDP